jgi:UDP-GlcNAc:undecaprenyl-phosphate GlcNAc-1-phosphate transferase
VARALGRGVLVDRGRKDADGRAMPRSGGMGIALAWAIAILATTGDAAESMRLLTLGGFALVVGLHDDLRNSSPRWRLAVLAALALNATALGFRVDVVTLPGGAVWNLGVFAVPLSAAWILGTTVAFDFADGIDGLAGGLAAIACLGIAALAPPGHAALAAGALGGASLAFFLYNRPPATIHMGNNGSNLLGFTVGVLTLGGLAGGDGGLPVLPGLLLIAVPVTDAALTVLRRGATAESLFSSDQAHIHHRLQDRYGTPRALTLLLMTAAICAITAAVPGKGALGLLVIGGLLYEVSSPPRRP